MKRQVINLVGIIVLATVLTTNSKATTDLPIKDLAALESSQEARAAFAEKLASFYRRVNDDIPNLKPSESEWLQKETERTGHGIDSTRAYVDRMELEKSREWHIARAKEQLDQLEIGARYIATSIRRYVKMSVPENKSALISLEMKQWIHFSNEQLDVNPFEHYLELMLHYDLHASEAMPLMGGWALGEGKVVDTPKQIAGTINKYIIERYLNEQTSQIMSNIPTNASKSADVSSTTNGVPTK